jgi:hypothetical protein
VKGLSRFYQINPLFLLLALDRWNGNGIDPIRCGLEELLAREPVRLPASGARGVVVFQILFGDLVKGGPDSFSIEGKRGAAGVTTDLHGVLQLTRV